MSTLADGRTMTQEHPAQTRLRAVTGVGWTTGTVWRLIKQARIDLTFGGLLVYIGVIITLRLPLGEVAVLAGIGGLIFSRHRLVVPTYLWWLLAFIVWCALGLVVSALPAKTQTGVEMLIKIWVVSLLAVNSLRTPARLAVYASVFLFCFLTHPMRSIFTNFVKGIAVNGGRFAANGEFSNPNQFAVVTLTVLGLALCLFIWHRRGSPRWLGAVCVLLCPAAILLTQSRGVFIGMSVFTLLLVAGSRKKGTAITALAGILLVGAMVAPPQVWKRLGGLSKATSAANLREVDPEGSAAERYEIWQTALRIIADRPIMGAGVSTYSYVNSQYAPNLGKKDTHSTYLNVLAETGVVGFALYLSMLVSLFSQVRKSMRLPNLSTTTRSTMRVLLAGCVGFLIAGTWGSYSTLSFFYLYLAVVSATAAVAVRESTTAGSMPTPHESDDLFRQVALRVDGRQWPV